MSAVEKAAKRFAKEESERRRSAAKTLRVVEAVEKQFAFFQQQGLECLKTASLYLG